MVDTIRAIVKIVKVILDIGVRDPSNSRDPKKPKIKIGQKVKSRTLVTRF